ncbi:MAG: hypothetical protein ACFFCO_08360 [Promethearchaeota archaeon]
MTNGLLLVESIRAFAGKLAQSPIWVFTPEPTNPLSTSVKKRFQTLNVSLFPFRINRGVLQFFFAGVVHAAALAEKRAEKRAALLAFLNPNTLVLQEPSEFLLPSGKSLGFRPVHHTLIGSRFDEPLDPFWTQVYNSCGVSEGGIFPMITHVDAVKIRPYFNAGFIITRPEKGIFEAWRDTFFRTYQNPSFKELYQQDELYKIFIHQAILSGVILQLLPRSELYELPHSYNYPLHLYEEDVSGKRPSALEDVVTLRHEGFYKDPEWSENIPVGDSLKQWIINKLESISQILIS